MAAPVPGLVGVFKLDLPEYWVPCAALFCYSVDSVAVRVGARKSSPSFAVCFLG